ncbi:Uncharacterised protein [Citrobacter freundii]|nr:Uncharacterised protein [Citrobacter freundii]
MKHWLMGVVIIAVSGIVQSENHRIEQLSSQRQCIWGDIFKGNDVQSFETRGVPPGFIKNDNNNVKVQGNILLRTTPLRGYRSPILCSLNNACERGITRCSGGKNKKWKVKAVPVEVLEKLMTPECFPLEKEDHEISPVADRMPWQAFTLQGGCSLRTFWQDNIITPDLFIPVIDSGCCEKGGWLSGRTVITQSENGKEKKSTVAFIHGFLVVGLNETADLNKLLIISVNNERMVLGNERDRRSWMILPYVPDQNGWQITGTLAIEISREVADDPVNLQAKVDAARGVWTPWLPPDVKLNIVLIDRLQLLLRNPAASTWHPAC